MLGKVLTLGVLYFVQGLPYGFQDKFMPMYLRGRGLSHTRLSLLKLLLVPWLGRAAFGPLIDRRWSKWRWLLLSLAALAATAFLGTLIDADEHHFRLLCAWLFCLNLFSAFQDVSVDALALTLLRECEMGVGNTAQVVGYKLGSLFGGGVLFWVHHSYGWSHLCYALTSLYVASMLVLSPLYVGRASKRKRSEDQDVERTSGDVDSIPRSPTDGGAATSSSNDEESYENVSRRRRRRTLRKESSKSLLDTLEENGDGESDFEKDGGAATSSSNDEESYENVSRRRRTLRRESSKSLLDTFKKNGDGESHFQKGEVAVGSSRDPIKEKDSVPEDLSPESGTKPSSIEELHENLLQRRKRGSSEDEEETRAPPPRMKKYSMGEIPELIINTRGTVPVIVFLLLYKLGERGALSTFPVFLVDQGVSTQVIGLWSGVIGQTASLLGSICSGWIIACKWDFRCFLHNALLARTIPVAIQWVIVNIWFTALPSFIQSFLFYVSALSLVVLEFIAGVVTTSVSALMMRCALGAPPSLQATHYSVLSSVETAGKLLFASLSGALLDWMGPSRSFLLFLTLSAPMPLLLPFLDC